MNTRDLLKRQSKRKRPFLEVLCGRSSLPTNRKRCLPGNTEGKAFGGLWIPGKRKIRTARKFLLSDADGDGKSTGQFGSLLEVRIWTSNRSKPIIKTAAIISFATKKEQAYEPPKTHGSLWNSTL